MGFKLSARSLLELEGVHPHLVKVVKRAIELTKVDFRVTDGMRTLKEQQAYFKSGASKTMRSRHLTGHAVDVVALLKGGGISWEWQYYVEIAVAFKQAARECNVKVEWGGDWKRFKDAPHFELDRKTYPA